MAVTVDELRARAKTAGFPVGPTIAAERSRDEAAALARLRAAARRTGEIADAAPVDVENVVWRVVAVAPGPFGAPVAAEIAVDLTELGFRGYCPLARKVVRLARTRAGTRPRCVVARPVFGEYLFVGEGRVPLVRGVHPRLLAILGGPGGPFAVPADAVAAISAAECAGRWDETRAKPRQEWIAPGVNVRIVSGPLETFAAVVEGVERAGRVRIGVAMFGGSTSVHVAETMIEAA